MNIVLAENFRAVFYAPFYAALVLGEFRKRGVEVSLVESASPGSAIESMYAGQVDLVWGGPLRAIKLQDDGASSDKALISFCEVVGKDPFFLVSQAPASPFTLHSLLHGRLGVVSEVPTPWLCLQEDLRDAGLDPNAVPIVADRTMAQNLDALAAGQLTVAQFFEPYVSLAELQGTGHPVYASASRGMTAYTTFLSTAASINKNKLAFEQMAQAIVSIRDWVNTESPAAIAKVIEPFYPHVPGEALRMSMARYQQLGLWTCQPTVSRKGFERLRQSMRHGGFIRSEPSYESCVMTL